MAGRGRPRKLTPEEAEHVRTLYFYGVTPKGKRYKLTDIARMYNVNSKTIANVVEFKAPYEKKGQDERQAG